MNLLVLVADTDTLGQRIAKEIEQLAKKQRISQKEMLARAKIGTTSFSDYKNGNSSPTIERLEALCAAIGQKLTVRAGAAEPRGLNFEVQEVAERLNALPKSERQQLRDSIDRLLDSWERSHAKSKT